MSNFSQPLPNIQVTVDVVIFTVVDGQLQVLLINRDGEPFMATSALPGGYLQADEQTLQTAQRVLRDKAGVENVFMEQLYTFDAPHRDPRGRILSVAYFALVPESHALLSGEDVQTPRFAPVNDLPDLAFDHAEMIAYGVQRLRSKLEYTNVVYSLLPPMFTLSELQHTYEAILGQTLDKRNFQKKFTSLGLLDQTSEMTSGGQHRPARLYRFSANHVSELKRFF